MATITLYVMNHFSLIHTILSAGQECVIQYWSFTPGNTDCDLDGTGKDGPAEQNLNNNKSTDAVIQVNSGECIGLAKDC